MAISQQLSLNAAIELLTSKCPFNCDPLTIKYEIVPITLLLKKNYLNSSNYFTMRIHELPFIEDFDANIQSIKSIDAFYTKMADFMQNFPYCFR